MKELIKRLHKDESGQGMAEYAIILVVIALVAVAGFTYLGNQLNTKVHDASNALN
ncbi:MAG TPA: Flp family type IVb pilin [Desulfotomaculum sp.]|nr:Flp family type IVb pilin [Desulfotomaculum sp.]